MTIKHPKIEKMIAKMPDDVGMGRVGSVTAMATARHAATDGALKAHLSSIRITHGYAVMKLKLLAEDNERD